MKTIIINPHNCSREEYQELLDYLENNSWDYTIENQSEDDIILQRLAPYISYDDPQEVLDKWKSLTEKECYDLLDDHFTMIESMEYSSIRIKDVI